MGNILGGQKFKAPKNVDPPAVAVEAIQAPATDVQTATNTDTTGDEMRKKFRPGGSSVGTSGTGLSL